MWSSSRILLVCLGLTILATTGVPDRVLAQRALTVNSTADSSDVSVGSGSAGSTIRGMVVNNFGGDGIKLEFTNSSWIACSNIGTDVDGMTDQGNAGYGINLVDDRQDHTIVIGTNGVGQDDASEGNIMSGNGLSGIIVGRGADNTRVSGNYIGFNSAGNGTIANAARGIFSSNTSSVLFGTDGDGTSDGIEANTHPEHG